MPDHKGNTLIAFDNFFKDKDLKGLKVLDVGCKGGVLTQELERRGLDWYGIDIETIGNNPRIFSGDMSDMKMIGDNEFDLIFICHAFEHCERPVDTLRELKRISRKWIFISTPNPCKHQVLNADEDHIFCLSVMQMKRLFRYTEIKEIKMYLQTEGIDIEQNYNVISIGEV